MFEKDPELDEIIIVRNKRQLFNLGLLAFIGGAFGGAAFTASLMFWLLVD